MFEKSFYYETKFMKKVYYFVLAVLGFAISVHKITNEEKKSLYFLK